MLAVGVSAATDVTGFGLAGHGLEMADGSSATLRIRLSALPLFPGIEGIDVTKHRTRAIKSNREYSEPRTRFDGTQNAARLDFVYDPQTSGGLLISTPADKVVELARLLKEGGALATVIGEVLPRQTESLIFAN
jgi:selenide, water dikinase